MSRTIKEALDNYCKKLTGREPDGTCICDAIDTIAESVGGGKWVKTTAITNNGGTLEITPSEVGLSGDTLETSDVYMYLEITGGSSALYDKDCNIAVYVRSMKQDGAYQDGYSTFKLPVFFDDTEDGGTRLRIRIDNGVLHCYVHDVNDKGNYNNSECLYADPTVYTGQYIIKKIEITPDAYEAQTVLSSATLVCSDVCRRV